MGFALVRIAEQDDRTVELETAEGTDGTGVAAEQGVPAELAKDAPAPEVESEVGGRDLKFLAMTGRWVFHRWLAWGFIYDQFGNYRFLYHYHPHGTRYAIYYE